MLTFSKLGRYGRFCNQMFQIAGTIGLARKHGYAYGFPQWKNYDHLERFGSSEDIDLQKYFVNPLPQLDSIGYPDHPIPWGYHPGMHIPDNVSLSGHMQSEKYFSHCKDIIQHYFAMKDEHELQDVCAVHVRLGDYDDHYHPRLKRNYYLKAMNLFPKGQQFVIFSDDQEGAYEITKDTDFAIGQSGFTNYIDDFRFMKSCKHFITGNSSYSLMAAILGRHPDKKIVCPSNWFGPAWGSCYKELPKDVYPENAIII